MKEDIVLANESLNKWCNTEGINYYEGIEALGNLFKWVVPKLFSWSLGKNWELDNDSNVTIIPNGIKATVDLVRPEHYDQVMPSEAISEDPALSLFWAIWKVIHVSN
jgi:hypothetical protein